MRVRPVPNPDDDVPQPARPERHAAHVPSLRELLLVDLLVTADSARAPAAEDFLREQWSDERRRDGSFAKALAQHLAVGAEELDSAQREVGRLFPEQAVEDDAPELSTDERYEALELMGKGGMGAVYAVRDDFLGRVVALKTLTSARSASGEGSQLSSRIGRSLALASDRLMREAAVTGSLEHPGVVPVYDVGQTGAGQPYYTMRAVPEGKTLQVAIASCETMADRLELLHPFVRVCDTIRYAHSRGVVHRDIKPANIALGQFGEVLVLDWGFAEKLDSEENAPAQVVGTPGYMAPEVALHARGTADPRVDVYGLGATLYHILTGAPPLVSPTLQALRDALTSPQPYVSPTALDSNVPLGISDVCMRALDPDPADRYASVDELADATRSWRRSREDHLEAEHLLDRARIALRDAATTDSKDSLNSAIDKALGLCAQAQQLVPDHPGARGLARTCDQRRQREIGRIRGRAVRRVAIVALAVVAVVAAGFAWLLDDERRAAQTQGERADALAGFMLTELHDQLRAAGRLDLLDAVARRSLAYYQSIDLHDAADQTNHAAALTQVGEVLLAAGDAKKASVAYGRARTIREELHAANPANRKYALGVAVALANECLSLLHLGEIGRAGELIARGRSLMDAAPPGEAEHAWRSHVLRIQAEIELEEGRYTDAARSFQASLAQAEADRAGGLSTVELLVALADVQIEIGRSDAAQGNLSRARSLARTGIKDQPGDVRWREKLALASLTLSRLHEEHGQLREAVARANEGVELRRSLSKADATSTRRGFELCVALRRLGRAQFVSGHPSDAAKQFQRSIEVSTGLVEADPKNVVWRCQLAATRRSLAEVHVSEGDVARAIAVADLAVGDLQAVEDTPSATWRSEHALVRSLLAGTRRDRGDRDAEREALESVMAAQREVLRRDDTRTRPKYVLATCKMNYGMNLIAGRSDVEGARDACREASEILRSLVAQNPRRVLWKMTFAENEQRRALLARLENAPAAALAFEKECVRLYDSLLVNDDGMSATAARSAAAAHLRCAELYEQAGDVESAKAARARGLKILEGVNEPGSVSATRQQAGVLQDLAEAYRASGDLDRAVVAGDYAVTMRRHLAQSLKNDSLPKYELALVLRSVAQMEIQRERRIRAAKLFSECVAVEAELRTACPDSDHYMEHGAYSLALQSGNFRVMRRPADALKAAVRALELHAEAVKRSPARAVRHDTYKQHVDDCRLLTGDRPARSRHEHATIAHYLFASFRLAKALPHFKEALYDEAVRAELKRGTLSYGAACASMLSERASGEEAAALRRQALAWIGDFVRRVQNDVSRSAGTFAERRRRRGARAQLDYIRDEWEALAAIRNMKEFQRLFSVEVAGR